MRNNICVVGGFDRLSKLYYKEVLSKKSNAIFLNLNGKNIKKQNLFNFEIYELKKILSLLNDKNVSELIFLGKIQRPNLENFKLDGVIDKYIPMLSSAYNDGDGQLLNVVLSIFKINGFKISSPLSQSKSFNFIKGEITKIKNIATSKDINKGISVLNTLSKYDNAQSIVIVDGYILAIEAVEGTDKMLERVFYIRKKNKNLAKKCGTLVKLPKKGQSKLIDLPVIGPKTIDLVVKANLECLVIDHRFTMIENKNKIIELAKKNKIEIHSI